MDSAAGTAKEARNRRNQAILSLRGKVLNSAKTNLTKMLGNNEIQSIIASFGLSVSSDGSKIIVDEKKLRYDKFIMLTDADKIPLMSA